MLLAWKASAERSEEGASPCACSDMAQVANAANGSLSAGARNAGAASAPKVWYRRAAGPSSRRSASGVGAARMSRRRNVLSRRMNWCLLSKKTTSARSNESGGARGMSSDTISYSGGETSSASRRVSSGASGGTAEAGTRRAFFLPVLSPPLLPLLFEFGVDVSAVSDPPSPSALLMALINGVRSLVCSEADGPPRVVDE